LGKIPIDPLAELEDFLRALFAHASLIGTMVGRSSSPRRSTDLLYAPPAGTVTASVTMHSSRVAPAPTRTSSHRIDPMTCADGSIVVPRPIDGVGSSDVAGKARNASSVRR